MSAGLTVSEKSACDIPINLRRSTIAAADTDGKHSGKFMQLAEWVQRVCDPFTARQAIQEMNA